MTGVKRWPKRFAFSHQEIYSEGNRLLTTRKRKHRTAIGNSGETTQAELHLDPFLQCYLITLLHLFALITTVPRIGPATHLPNNAEMVTTSKIYLPHKLF